MPNTATMNFTKENFEYNAITGEVIYIDQDGIRKNITLNAVIIANYSELKRIHTPKYNAIYLDNESKKVYAFNATGWIELFTHAEVQKVISHLDDLTPSIITDEDGNYLAPSTTIGNIYSDHKYDMHAFINDDTSDYLRKLHHKEEYVMLDVDGQRVINIPYPYSNYNHKTNYMNLIIDNKVVPPADYYIADSQLILRPRKYAHLKKGQIVLFTFYYAVMYNLNEKVVLQSQNIANHAITTDKLHPNILIKANNVAESTSRIWFTPQEKEKLRGLNPYNYVHPDTHPASIITETEDRKWVSPEDITRWDAKANKEDVFTKEETERKFGEWAGAADLASFRQFAEALGNDPNFATTILRKLSEKVGNKEFKELQEVVEEKVNYKDYVRSDIYDLGTKVTSDDIDLYSIRLADGTFGEYIDGMSVVLKISETNKNKCKLRINNLDYKPILNSDKFELIEGELKRDSIYHLRYNGTTGNFILQGKGGVKITDCSLSKYKAGQDSTIGRGNPIDIDMWNNLISRARHRIEPICKLTTGINNLKKESDIYVDLAERKTVFNVWQDGNKVYGATYNIAAGYIENSTTNTYSLLHDKVDSFAVCKVASGVYAIAFAKGDEIIIKIIPVDSGKISLGELEGTIVKATGMIKKPIYFEACGLDKFILIYSHSNVTETHMFEFNNAEKKLSTVSKRNNLDYPIDVCQRINKNQIVFAGNYLNSIIGWVLTVSDNDFANSETTRLAQISDTTKVYTNIKLFPLVKDRALLEFNIDDARCKKILNIHFNGDIRITEDSVYTENANERKHNGNILKRAYVVNMDGFVSASNYDATLESATGNGETIKLLLQREGNNGLMYTTDTNNQFLLEDSMFNHDIKVYNEIGILSYVSSLGVIKLVLFRIIRRPNGIAIENANQGEMCKFYKF